MQQYTTMDSNTDQLNTVSPGTLYLVPVPIGNLGDITLRALEVLRGVDVVAAEDTRVFRGLQRAYDIATPAISYHDHNERQRVPLLLARLQAGETVAVVSDAGTPLINDPGFQIVQAAIAAGIDVVSLPGPSAITTALAGAGLPTNRFLYVGYPPRTGAKRRAFFGEIATQPATLVLYEAPHRIAATLADMREVFGDRDACLARNISKPHERYQRGRLSQLQQQLAAEDEIRGELTVIVAGAEPIDAVLDVDDEIAEMLEQGLDQRTIRERLADAHGMKRRDAYAAILRVQAELGTTLVAPAPAVLVAEPEPDYSTAPVESDVGPIVQRVLLSRRYRSVAPDLIARLAAEELPKAEDAADAEKRTKRRLHQIFGAYTGQQNYARLLLDIHAAAERDDAVALRDACRQAMAAHASTRERLPILADFYGRLHEIVGTPASVVDIASGLNPLAVPWMSLAPAVHYTAYDIDQQLLDVVAGALPVFGVSGRTGLRDVVTNPPDDVCDLALLLKSVPCLDQQDPDASARILQTIQARHVVVSFPTRSLGGRGKGMFQTYSERFRQLLLELRGRYREVAAIELDNELLYIIERFST